MYYVPRGVTVATHSHTSQSTRCARTPWAETDEEAEACLGLLYPRYRGTPLHLRVYMRSVSVTVPVCTCRPSRACCRRSGRGSRILLLIVIFFEGGTRTAFWGVGMGGSRPSQRAPGANAAASASLSAPLASRLERSPGCQMAPVRWAGGGRELQISVQNNRSVSRDDTLNFVDRETSSACGCVRPTGGPRSGEVGQSQSANHLKLAKSKKSPS